ncbi:hypothetical protein [Tahibacter amnicola]|uniref:Uncharacterized protein n=1 Tax=Tahibacter amnicola TaxID=2976241 RepID=A0ABY6BI39_9GAMM|nr:hypothetical protein [Tahibacter amnicola]UXI67527.1 hypothetical protein N4264_22760 [Tahibacter amnicola]
MNAPPTVYPCRVCGLLHEQPLWGQDDKTPSWEVCVCCGYQVGYHDCSPVAARHFRETWIARGARWRFPERCPPDWQWQAQVKNIPEQFLLATDVVLYPCRVCGLLDEVPPWGADGCNPSHDICVCCGSEAGYEDCLPEAARVNRQRWLDAGAVWFDRACRPPEWDCQAQLQNVPEAFR